MAGALETFAGVVIILVARIGYSFLREWAWECETRPRRKVTPEATRKIHHDDQG